MSQVVVAKGLMAEAGGRIRDALGGQTAAVVTDQNVAAHHLQALTEQLQQAGYRVECHILAPGEGSKSLDTYARLLGFLHQSGITRTDCVVALGGGVVGDVAAFAAATWLRAVGLAQIPTSLLAMVDSSVGGKAAIDLPQGKNLVGAFYPAGLTLVDPALLRTLPGEQYRDGLAEVIKYGIIKDEALFDLIPYDESEEEDIIRRCVQIKQQVVENDLYDKGERQLLNYGHTMGHALERLSGYTLPHGQAVAIGMALMARASHAMGCCTADAMGRVINLIHLMGLPTETDQHPDAIYQAMLGDKKRAGDRLTLVTLHAIGDCRLTPVGVEEALRWVQAGCGA